MNIREYFSRNERNRRTVERGKAPRRERVTAEVKSRTPIYRDRINPAHGNKHREDGRLHRSRDEGLARMKAARERTERAAREDRARADRAELDRQAAKDERHAKEQDRFARATGIDPNRWHGSDRQQRPDRARREPEDRPGRSPR